MAGHHGNEAGLGEAPGECRQKVGLGNDADGAVLVVDHHDGVDRAVRQARHEADGRLGCRRRRSPGDGQRRLRHGGGKLAQAHRAEKAAGAVEHGQRADVVREQQAARGVGAGIGRNRHHVAGHDVGAGDFAALAQQGLKLDLPQQRIEVGAADVEGLVQAGDGRIDIGRVEADAEGGRRIGGLVRIDRADRLPVRILPPRKPVEQHADADEEQRIGRNRNEGKPEAGPGDGRPADDRGKRCRAPRRMQRAGERHGQDGKRHGKADGEHRIGDEGRNADAHQRRNGVAADDGPGLGQRAGGHGEKQHGRGADGGDDEGKMRIVAHGKTADEAGEADADQGPDAADQALLERGAGQDGNKQPIFRPKARFTGIVLWGGHDDPDEKRSR